MAVSRARSEAERIAAAEAFQRERARQAERRAERRARGVRDDVESFLNVARTPRDGGGFDLAFDIAVPGKVGETVSLRDLFGVDMVDAPDGSTPRFDRDAGVVRRPLADTSNKDYMALVRDLLYARARMKPAADRKGGEGAIAAVEDAREHLNRTIERLRGDKSAPFDEIKAKYFAAEAQFARKIKKAAKAYMDEYDKLSDELAQRTRGGKVGDETHPGFELDDVVGLTYSQVERFFEEQFAGDIKDLVRPYTYNEETDNWVSVATGDAISDPNNKLRHHLFTEVLSSARHIRRTYHSSGINEERRLWRKLGRSGLNPLPPGRQMAYYGKALKHEMGAAVIVTGAILAVPLWLARKGLGTFVNWVADAVPFVDLKKWNKPFERKKKKEKKSA